MNLGVIIQARMGSSRLPGKVLLKFSEDKSILDFVLEKLHQVPDVKVIVATSEDPSNDDLENYLVEKKENVYRGSENDVLERFICAAERFDVDGIIRICSDNPFLDVDGLIQLSQQTRVNTSADYIGFRINGKPSILTHFGFWGEYVSLSALKKVRELTSDKAAHEHVTNYVYKHPELFDCKWIDAPSFLEGREDIRLTIDTVEDLRIAQTIHESLVQKFSVYSLKDIVNYLDENEELKNRMSENIMTNQK